MSCENGVLWYCKWWYSAEYNINDELTAPKSTALNRYTVRITEPEKAGEISVTLMEVYLKKDFFYISRDGIIYVYGNG